jgi:glycosyltransferase involved in cell wall biosynthesis
MKAMMAIMRFALYHERLPEKSYYKNSVTQYISVPHGIYLLPKPDAVFERTLIDFKKNSFLLVIMGNIRVEKNYEMAIRCLSASPDLVLLIAGSLANSAVPIRKWKELAEEQGVAHRVLWSIHHLSESELAAIVKVGDCILLNYASGFTSQSGLLNMLGPFKKKVIISDTASGLTETARRFNLGEIIEADSQEALTNAVLKLKENHQESRGEWEAFVSYSSWERQIEIVLNACHE